MIRVGLCAAIATVALGCASLPHVQSGDTTRIPAEQDTPFSLKGTCDIAVRGAVLRTAIQAAGTSDSLTVVCVDEMGVTMVLVGASPNGVAVQRWFPPLRDRHARLVGLSAYGLQAAKLIAEADAGVYRLPAGNDQVDIAHLNGDCDTLYLGNGTRTTHQGTIEDSVLTVCSSQGDTVLVVRW